MVRWVQVAVAASVILVAGIFISRQLNPGMSSGELAANYYQQYAPDFSSTRQIDEPEATAQKYLDDLNEKNTGKMDEVIGYFSQQDEPTALYLLGHAFYIKKDFKNAIQNFKKYLKTAPKTERDYERAQFYLALAYLADGDTEATMYQLNYIRTLQNHSFKSQSESLFKALQKN